MKQQKLKLTEIGRIPIHWAKISLKEIIDIKHGYAFKGEFFTDDETENILLTPGNFTIGGGFKSDKLKFYNGEIPAEYVLSEGDIIITMTDLSKSGDTLGYSAKVPNIDKKRLLHNQRLGKVIFKKNSHIDGDFLYWLLRTREYRNHVLATASGTSVKHTSPTRILDYSFHCPSLPEQRAIASILSTLDDKIALNRQMNATLERIGQALFKHWFVDFEFPNKEGKPYTSSGGEMVETELGEVPAGWKIQDIYSCAEYINGEAFRNDDFSLDHSGLPIIKIVELKYGITSQTEFTNRDVDPKYKINNGDILFSWSGSPDTSIDTFIWTGGSGWLNQHIFKVTPHSPNEKQFVYFLLHYHKQTFIEIARDKQTTGLGHVTIKDLKRILFVIPPKKFMDQFENVAGPLFNHMLCNSLESSTLSAIRDALLPKLMSAEIRVKVE